MKNQLLVLLCLFPFIGFSQDMETYTASNAKTYKIGDTVRVALGSMPDGNFKYVQASPPLFALPTRNSNSLSARKDFANTNVIIRKIKKSAQLSGSEKVVFNVKVRGIVTYDIWIEEAISACEVTPCATKTNPVNTGTGSVADELLKLKKLLDDNAITTEEFNAQKKKLLSQ
ncbi:hypothetical protein GCM10027049_15010 [Mucilaginibacter puniceus]